MRRFVSICALVFFGCHHHWHLELNTEPEPGGIAVVGTCEGVTEVRYGGRVAPCTDGHVRLSVPYADLTSRPEAYDEHRSGGWQNPGRWLLHVTFLLTGDPYRHDEEVPVHPWEIPEGALTEAKPRPPGQLPLSGPDAVTASWSVGGSGPSYDLDGLFGRAQHVDGLEQHLPELKIEAAPGTQIEIAGQPLGADAMGRRTWRISLDDILTASTTDKLGTNPTLILPARVTPPNRPPRVGVVELSSLSLGGELAKRFADVKAGRPWKLASPGPSSGILLIGPPQDPQHPTFSVPVYATPGRPIGGLAQVAFAEYGAPYAGRACHYGYPYSVTKTMSARDLEVTIYDLGSGQLVGKSRIRADESCPEWTGLNQPLKSEPSPAAIRAWIRHAS